MLVTLTTTYIKTIVAVEEEDGADSHLSEISNVPGAIALNGNRHTLTVIYYNLGKEETSETLGLTSEGVPEFYPLLSLVAAAAHVSFFFVFLFEAPGERNTP